MQKTLLGLLSTLFANRLWAKPKTATTAAIADLPMVESEPWLGQINICAYPFAPKNWAFCNGQLLPINQQNLALFTLLGTTYGGNGTTTFGLPDFRGRMPIHRSSTYLLGYAGGLSTTTLTSAQIPPLSLTTKKVLPRDATGTQAVGVVEDGANGSNATILSRTGTGTAHDNMPPYLTLNFIIALFGIVPSRP